MRSNKINTVYYLSKSERPYSDFEELLQLQEKNGAKYQSFRNDRCAANLVDTCGQVIKNPIVEDLLRAKYYSVLMDGSTDSGITEQELIYILYLSKNGIPEVKIFSVVSVKATDAEGLKSSREQTFERTGILSFEKLDRMDLMFTALVLTQASTVVLVQRSENTHHG